MQKHFQRTERPDLPNGEWVIFGSLPAETTPENFSAWLYERGFDVSPDRVNVKSYGRRCCAIVSFPYSEFTVMVNWVINGQKFFDIQAVAQTYSKSERQSPLGRHS